jgi:hypothetical protein
MGNTTVESRSPLRDRFLFVNVSILMFLVLGPVVERLGVRALLDAFLCVVFLTTIRAVAVRRTQTVAATLLLVPFLVTLWIGRYAESKPFAFSACVLGVAFLGYAIVLILRHVFRSPRVTGSTIFAAVSVYLLLALTWALVFLGLEIVEPGSFKSPGEALQITQSGLRFVYFSFVTLTTVGYGDFTPNSSLAGGIAVIESVVGQIYLVVQVAWLVGMHVSEAAMKRKD